MSMQVGALLAAMGLCVAIAPTARGQENLSVDDVRVTKAFDARLTDAERVQLPASLPPVDTTTVAQRYEVIAVESDVAYDPPKIRPLAVRANEGEEEDEAYRGFVRAGAGLPAAWLGDLGYRSRAGNVGWRLDGHTYGFAGNANDDQRYAEVNATGGATYYVPDGLAIDFDLDYDRRQYRYFGYAAAVGDTTGRDTLRDDLLRQHFGVLGVRAGLRSVGNGDSGIDYYARASAAVLSDNFAAQESRFRLEAGGRRDFGEMWYASASLDVDLTNFEGNPVLDDEQPTEDQTLNNFTFTPSVGAHRDRLGVRVGVAIANSDDEFSFFPALEASYQVVSGVTVVAGAEGGLLKNDYARLTRYLPWLVSDPELRNTQRYRGFVGLQGRASGIDYSGRVSLARERDLALFVVDERLPYRYRPVYDTATVIGVNVELSAPLAARLSGQVALDSRFYSLEEADEPFGLPTLEIRGRARYEVTELVGATAHVAFQNGLPFPVAERPGEVERGEILADVSVSGDYRFSQRFSAFAQANNLLNNRREKFLFYPTLGANVVVGVTGRF